MECKEGAGPQYAELIGRTLDYIEANLGENISLYDIANRAGFSVPHFYRLFKASTGRPVGSYVLMRRLARAAHALLESGGTVSEIAYEHGFGSHDVFTRAFIREYGMPPSRFRKHGAGCDIAKPATAAPLVPLEAGTIAFHVIQRGGFFVIGMRCSAMEWDEDNAVGRLWSDFLPRVDEIARPALPLVMMGLCEPGRTEPGRFPYMAAVVVCPGAVPPPGMAVKKLRAQRFVEARIPERMSVRDAYTLTLNWAAESGHTVARGSDFIEVYEELFCDPADHSFILWIPIE